MQVGSGNGSDAPLSLGRESLRLIVTQRRRDDLVSVFVHSPANLLLKSIKLLLLIKVMVFQDSLTDSKFLLIFHTGDSLLATYDMPYDLFTLNIPIYFQCQR